MSEQALWYVARIAGLMTLILAFGSLCAGFLVRTREVEPTPAAQWAIDTHRFLGVSSLVALVLHGSATVAGERSNLSVADALSGIQAGNWLSAGLLAGIVCGWLLILVETGRATSAYRRSRSDAGPGTLDMVTTFFAVVVVSGGAYHAWMIGSDTRNVVTLSVAGFAAVVLVGTAALGAGTLFQTETSPPGLETSRDTGTARDPETDRLVGMPTAAIAAERSLGSWRVSVDPSSNGEHNDSPDRFDPQLTVSLSRRVGQPTAPPPVSRGPEIASARNMTAHEGVDTESTPPPPQHRRRN